MKKTLLVSLAVSVLTMFAAPAFADSVLQIWSCKLEEDKTVADVIAVSSAWFKAAKSMEGGSDIQVSLEFPIAANAGDGEFSFVLIVDDAKTWGILNNDYADSPAAEADIAWGEVASCSESSLWNSIDIE